MGKPQPKDKNPSKQIAEVKVRPAKHERVLIGTFSETEPPFGFAVETPDDPSCAVISVMTHGTEDCYKLLLKITNQSRKTASIKIWAL